MNYTYLLKRGVWVEKILTTERLLLQELTIQRAKKRGGLQICSVKTTNP